MNLSAKGGSFLSLQFDGINFWSLEQGDAPNQNSQRIIRRWLIQNFMCVLQDSWILRARTAENINGGAFAIESYTDTITEACGYGTSRPDSIKLRHPRAAFFQVSDRFYLISATQNITQEVQVAAAGDPDYYTVRTNGAIGSIGSTQNTFYPGDRIVLRRDLYFFNNESPSQGSAGAALYWYAIPFQSPGGNPTDLLEPTFKSCHESGIYEQTQAAVFVTVEDLAGINQGKYAGLIAYVRGQQLIFKRPNLASSLPYPGPSITGQMPTGFDYTGRVNLEFKENVASMIMDTAIKNDRITLHTIYDIAQSINTTTCTTSNIYRLQTDYTYGTSIEAAFTIGPYNYVVSVMKPMVTSIALTAEPALVVANGVDAALIWATVRDQYGAPINGKRLVFGVSATDAQAVGYFKCPDDDPIPVSRCVQGSFTWLDAAPHKQAEVITGTQSSYLDGPPSMGGQAVIKWRAGTKAGLVTIVAIVQP
jgi:hypothetical protein